jgi:hypothetical protein
MVGFSVDNLKDWARRSTRKERIVAKQSRSTSHPTTTDETEQSQRTSTVSQPLAATAEAEENQRESLVAPKIATAAETEQSHCTSFVAHRPAITPV